MPWSLMVLLNGALAGATPDYNLLKKGVGHAISLDALDPDMGMGSGRLSRLPRVTTRKRQHSVSNTVDPIARCAIASGPRGAHIALALTHSRRPGTASSPRSPARILLQRARRAFPVRHLGEAKRCRRPSRNLHWEWSVGDRNPRTEVCSIPAAHFAGMVSCAIACGAFPFAFAPRALGLVDDQEQLEPRLLHRRRAVRQ